MAEDASNGASEYPELDIKKLHELPSEQQDRYLLTFTANLARHVTSLDADGASAQQIYVKKELFKVINLSSPAPTRVIRNNLGRTFAAVFGKGDRKLLFESINELVAILNTGKTDKDIKCKHAAAHCLGAVFEAAGDSAISLANLASSTLLRLLKLAQNNTGLRGTIFKSLGKIFKGVGPSADEPSARDVWKQARSAASSDKSLLVQASACNCMEYLVRYTAFFDNSADFDKMLNALWKAIDSQASHVRHQAASCLAAALVKNYSDSPNKEPVPKVKKPKKANKKKNDLDGDDEMPERPDSPAPSKPATLLSFGISDLLRQLSTQYCKPATSVRARAGIVVCYIKALRELGPAVVETSYGEISRHFFNDLLSYPSIVHNRHRLLSARKHAEIVLETVIAQQLLGENGQVNAAKYLINNILKDYPQVVKERPEPTKQALTAALSALTSLINSLGAATSAFAESCREALLQVLQHPSYTVQIHASACLRAFVLACPQQLLPCVTICMNSVNRELNLLTGARQSPRRCVGFANGLSAALSTSTLQPLYGSVDVNSRVLSQATTLLKSSGSSDLRISSTQIQVAWILIGGLMTLGPSFVKIHLSQLLLLWKNALPKPLNRDNMYSRNLLELSFLAHVRECALGSILTFLEFNSRILTLDVTKRLAAMLQNTAMFLNSLPQKKTTDDIAQRLSPALQLQDFDLMVRRRVLQCYTRLVNLSPSGADESLLQTNLLPFAVASFADPDSYTPSSLSSTIASSASTFESIWDVTDNCGYGVTGLVRGYKLKPLPGEQDSGKQDQSSSQGDAETIVDQTILSPICSAREHDSVTIYVGTAEQTSEVPDPPATEVVNAAITLFATTLPLYDSKVQESMLEQVSSFLSSTSLQRDPARKAAITVNIAVALLSALKVAVKDTSSASGQLRGDAVERVMQELLHVFISHPDQYIRHVASEALGRLSRISGNIFTSREVKWLLDQIAETREPHVRAGCAIALGCIHSQLGGMAAGFHLKSIQQYLMSLASDPHPTVHYWALESLSRVSESAGLAFTGYVMETLGLIAQLYIADTHNDEAPLPGASNLEVELLTPMAIARCVDSTINVLGPDLQDMTKAREMIMTLIELFQQESNIHMLVQALRCQENLALYAPGHIHYAAYVKFLQNTLQSESILYRDIALNGLYNLMRADATAVLKTADPGLDDQLWNVLNQTPNQKVARNIIRNWLEQTALSEAGAWVDRCQTVLTKTLRREAKSQTEKTAKSTGAPDLQDEEVAGFAAASGAAQEESNAAGSATQELLKWQVRTFAMECLGELLTTVAKEAAVNDDSPAVEALQSKVADVVRIAFSASTGGVVQLRIQGLKIVDQILKIFGKTPDPDFPEVTLLEQYQAQIGSALTPAFAADSSPELAAEAVSVCASFIATGIVTDVDRMGRILKLLVSALESFSDDSETATIGDLKGLSSNAQVMVKMSVFSAWAELQIASAEQKYLVDVLRPHIVKLTPLWLSSLREYARLRFEPDISTTGGTASLSGNLDTIYAALNRETLLKFYQQSWLNLVDAIASLIDEDSEFVFDALDGKTDADASTPGQKPSDINYRDEPVAFFFVLFGLAFEALAGRPGDREPSNDRVLEILQALKKILRPSVSGHAIYQEVVFSETMDMLDRLVLTEGLAVQSVIVDIARNLCLGHPSARSRSDPVGEEKLSEDIDQLFELTRIIVLVIAGLVPALSENKAQVRAEISDEATIVLSSAISSLVDAAEVFPTIIKTDLHACILHIFATILGTGFCQATIVPQSLPVFKRYVSSLNRVHSEHLPETRSQLRGTLNRFLAILFQAQKRESDAAVPCEKNTLLATTILLTSVAPIMDPSDPLLKRFIDAMGDCLGNRLTSRVAANCCRSILLLPRKGPVEDALVAMLLPYVFAFLTHPSDVEGLDETRSLLTQTLTSFVQTLKAPQLGGAMALIIPVLLSRASREGEGTYRETAIRLLELASAAQAEFRAVVAGMDEEQKQFMEGVIKSGAPRGDATQNVRKDEGQEPSIALKMDFGV